MLTFTALLIVTAGACAAGLRLDTDFAALLPARDPTVMALTEMDRRMTALTSVSVVVQGPDRAANRRFAHELATRLRALGDPAIDTVESGAREERAFFEHYKLLYVPLAELARARDRLERRITSLKNPLLVDLDDESESDEAPSPEKLPFASLPDGDFAWPDGRVYAVVVWLRTSVLGGEAAVLVARRIEAAARALQAERLSPGQSVGLTGRPITAAVERRALAADLTIATAVSVGLVCLSVLAFFGRPRALVFMVAPALCGVAAALAFARVAFGFLNSATSFMGAILVGNGINYAIIQMARYDEERRRGRPLEAAAVTAVVTTARGTGLASVCAALAYGALALTDFRGFNQFGGMGFVGMIVAWVATLVVLPAMWALFDRRPPHRVSRLRGFQAAKPLARLAAHRPRLVLSVGLAASVLALAPLPGYLRDPFEYDFNKLRNQAARRSPAEQLSAKLDPIFGRSLSPGFVLAPRRGRPSDAAEIKREILARDVSHILGSVRTIDDFLPGSPDEQRLKLAVLGSLRRLLDHNLPLLDLEPRERLAKLRPPDDLRVLTATDLPRGLRRFYTESDGTVGRVVAFFPREDVNVWDGRVLAELAHELRDLELSDGRQVYASGQAMIFGAMIDAVMRSAPIVTLASLAGVLLLVVLLARRRGAGAVVGSLCVGVLWMIGATAAAGVRVNFLNFVALPMTFGIGSDYAANLYLRYRLEGAGGIERAVASTGGAVALCSLTTVIGYGSLLIAETAGLRTFGAVAILGELCCLASALLLMPAAIAALEQRRTPATAPVTASAVGEHT